MLTYLYPQNLKAASSLWLWSLRDFVILCIGTLASAVLLVQAGLAFPMAVVLCRGFLTIRLEETTVMDFLGWAGRFFLTTQQEFRWR